MSFTRSMLAYYYFKQQVTEVYLAEHEIIDRCCPPANHNRHRFYASFRWRVHPPNLHFPENQEPPFNTPFTRSSNHQANVDQTSSNHRSNIQQMHSKYTCTTCVLARCLLGVCSTFAWWLLDCVNGV